MTNRSIHAYDHASRVQAYDLDMQIMHPNREKMVQIALDLLPCQTESRFRALDLGVGTGLFTAELLSRHPSATVVAVDGSSTMVELARARLAEQASRVDFRIGDFRKLGEYLELDEIFDVVLSSFALHHLSRDEKGAVARTCAERLRTGGWFVNADLIISESPGLEARIQELRVAGIMDRAPIGDERFRTASLTRQFLDNLEESEGDRPLTLSEDLACLREAGLESVAAVWLEFREAVTVGIKP